MKKIQMDQTYRRNVIAALKRKLAADEPWRDLILGADDPEVALSTSDFDREHVVKKTRHVIDALSVMLNSTSERSPITWKEACIQAVEENYSNICFRTVMRWYLDLHTTTTGDLRFNKSQRGSSSAEILSPFQEDESLLI